MANIETRTSTSNAALYAWKVTNTPAPIKASPSQSKATSDTGTKQAHKLREANEKAKPTYKHIMMDYDALKEEVSRYGNYMVVQDHVIVKGMKMRDPWKKHMKKIAKDFTVLTALTEADIKQGLFSDRSAKQCPQQIPTYSGSHHIQRQVRESS